jgi:hypothetical protein
MSQIIRHFLRLEDVPAKRPEPETPPAPPVDPALLSALAKIGNNINQITMWVNRHKSGIDAAKVAAQLAAIRRELERIEAENSG